MIYSKPIKTTIDKTGLVDVIVDVVVRHHGLAKSIINTKSSLFTSKF